MGPRDDADSLAHRCAVASSAGESTLTDGLLRMFLAESPPTRDRLIVIACLPASRVSVRSLARGRDGTTVCEASAERPLSVRRPPLTRSLMTR